MTSIRGVEKKKKKKKTQTQELDAKPQRTLSELRNQRDEMCTRDDNISSLLEISIMNNYFLLLNYSTKIDHALQCPLQVVMDDINSLLIDDFTKHPLSH